MALVTHNGTVAISGRAPSSCNAGVLFSILDEGLASEARCDSIFDFFYERHEECILFDARAVSSININLRESGCFVYVCYNTQSNENGNGAMKQFCIRSDGYYLFLLLFSGNVSTARENTRYYM